MVLVVVDLDLVYKNASFFSSRVTVIPVLILWLTIRVS